MNARAVADMMTVCLSRSVVDGDFIGVGLGTPIALVAAVLAQQTHTDVHIVAGGAFDLDGASEVWLGSREATSGNVAGYVSHFDSMDMAESQSMSLQFMRPAQVDSCGNLNTSRIGSLSAPSVRFPGGLATADVPSLLPRIIAYHPKHTARNFPERASFITGAGRPQSQDPMYFSAGVVTVVTNLCVMDFVDGSPTLRSVHPWSSLTEIDENTGFEVIMTDEVGPTPALSDVEKSALETMDSNRMRDAEIPALLADMKAGHGLE